ncbi:MAG: CHRD domain-containing protein [Burkholderiales bacterium]|nr:CHRD domain-containing protein [Burkholderiales bacterium]
MTESHAIRARAVLTVLAAAVLASACGTVDLGPRYSPPPIRMPESLPAAPAPAPAPPPMGAQSMPVPPAPASTPQPLPPATESAPEANPNLVTLTTLLDGASVIPPARSGAAGRLDALYDSSTRVLRWKASWDGLAGAITGVEFHGPADASHNAPATMIWPSPFGTRYEGRATLSPQQAADLVSGRWYVSVFTSSYPQGELRGQLRVVN